MGDDLPIDIDYNKFLDWLVDRRHVSKNWHSSLKAARVLLRSAADALPADATVTAPTTYYETMAVLSVLEDKSAPPPFAGARDTDMLGRYSHPAARAWASARTSYESGSAYLAEAAQALVRAANVEAPAIRADMARLKDVITDCARREGSTIRAAADARTRFEDACAEFSIDPQRTVDFEREIRAAVEREAPVLLRRAVDAAKKPEIATSLAYYEAFVEHTACSDVSSDDNVEDPALSSKVDDSLRAGRLCETLATVMKGDPDTLVRSVATDEGGEAKGGGIDWGALDGAETSEGADTSAAPVSIDWGIEIDESGAAAEELDASAPEPSTVESPTVDIIDWGELSAVRGDKPENVAQEHPVASSDTQTLSSSETREKYVTDLLELRAFLSQREAELTRASDSQVALVLQQYGGVPDNVARVDSAEVERMLVCVEEALNCISGPSACRALGLQSSHDGVARCARDLSEKMHAVSRIEGSIEALVKRKVRASEELRSLQPKFDALSTSARNIIRQTEAKISSLYKGREVNILGEINIVFAED